MLSIRWTSCEAICPGGRIAWLWNGHWLTAPNSEPTGIEHASNDRFEPLRRAPAKFRAMKIEGGTIAWKSGADIDPDVLYYNLKPAWSEEAEAIKA